MPWATAAAMEHGCNTPCVEVRDDRTGAYLVLDGGSGLVGLSDTFAGEPHPTPVLLSHYHWDHTQGLPFFGPLYSPGWTPEIFGPDFPVVPRNWAHTLFEPPNFPVPFKTLPNRPAMHFIHAKPLEVGGFSVSVERLTHPGGSFADRVHGPTGDLCYVTDHEFGDTAVDERLVEFCSGAGAIISDAHFTPGELPRHKGWGHASWLQCAELAAGCGARHLYLFHHKPGRTDAELRRILVEARQVFQATTVAAEGLAFEL
ncbi:MAG TPA: MBL fold metallo-hydrolase [Vicinamibacterales bacterium]|nr:MBL fold metallo-hydrolase [Vicinamibacterales bacterium]